MKKAHLKHYEGNKCGDLMANIGDNKLNFFWFDCSSVVNTGIFRNCSKLPKFSFC